MDNVGIKDGQLVHIDLDTETAVYDIENRDGTFLETDKTVEEVDKMSLSEVTEWIKEQIKNLFN